MKIKARAVGSSAGLSQGSGLVKPKEERLPSFSLGLPMSHDW